MLLLLMTGVLWWLLLVFFSPRYPHRFYSQKHGACLSSLILLIPGHRNYYSFIKFYSLNFYCPRCLRIIKNLHLKHIMNLHLKCKYKSYLTEVRECSITDTFCSFQKPHRRQSYGRWFLLMPITYP